jgi:AcrR family transcriptional regulator
MQLRGKNMAKKAPSRTAERILDVSLDIFNRFGEPNVSTTLISAALSISPGNLCYHFRAKDDLINRLFDRYEQNLSQRLQTSSSTRDIEQAWCFIHALLALNWQYRFLYRNLSDLVRKNRRLEISFQAVLLNKNLAIVTMLKRLVKAKALSMTSSETKITATNMVMLLSYWLNFEYAHNPRQALEPQYAQAALLRGVQQVLHSLHPYLCKSQRIHLQTLIATCPDTVLRPSLITTQIVPADPTAKILLTVNPRSFDAFNFVCTT